MTVILSTTDDDKYLYFLPIISWCWNKLGINVVCFMPAFDMLDLPEKMKTVLSYCDKTKVRIQLFSCPDYKEATYAQVSRLFGAALDLPEEEMVITGDIDMVIFRTDFIQKAESDFFDIYGSDLVPDGQLPMCYAVASVNTWRKWFTKGRTYQECLDAELAHEECKDMRGNLWCRDQELLAKGVGSLFFKHGRTNGQNQFAQNRIDRDDTYWRDRLNKEVIDAHLWRDGYTEENHANLIELLQFMYPEENFDWINTYRTEYIKLIKN